MSTVGTNHPIWLLRGAMSGVLFSMLFFWMGYTEPWSLPYTYILAAANLLIVAGFVAAYWYWPRRRFSRDDDDWG